MPIATAAGAAIAGGIASSATGALLSSALAPSPNIPGSQVSGGSGLNSLGPFAVTGPGANIQSFSKGDINADIGPQAQSYLDSLSGLTGTTNNALSGLLARVDPTFGDLVNSSVNAIRNARQRTVSDLGASLARRRVLGSSFGQDAVTRTGLDYDNLEAQTRAQGVLESIDAQSKLLNMQLANAQSLAEQELKQANFATSSAINLINGTQQTFADNSNVLGQLALANAQGIGGAVQQSGIGNQIGQLVTNALTPSTSSIPANVDAPGSGVGFGGGL